MRVRMVCIAAVVVALGSGSGMLLAQQEEHQHEAGAHRHPEAEKIKNPVKADETSIAAGKKVYDANCSQCHGVSGKGDGKMAPMVNGPKPSNLVDDEWKHGSTDGEIFVVVRDGVKGTGMKAFGSKLEAHQIWDVINYVRSIGPKPDKSH